MIASTLSACVDGIDAHLVEIEADVAPGLPSITIVGLTDKAVQEARDRVKPAIVNSGFEFPMRRLTVNLAPAQLRKEGSAFDLGIAIAVLMAAGMEELRPGAAGLIGELGLDGSVRPVRGALVLTRRLAAAGAPRVYVPVGNAPEAVHCGASVFPVDSLQQLVAHLRGEQPIAALGSTEAVVAEAPALDIAQIQGQGMPKRALEIAAAGGHHLLLSGPPGAGKSMLAKALAGLLPDLDEEASHQVTAIHSVAGLLRAPGLLRRPPLRAPHHSISTAGLLGGGATFRPGEVTLAHRGVLVLDELPEFQRNCIEAMREPLEEGTVRISRAAGTRIMPAAFTLAATANPCPCGRSGADPLGCACPPDVLARYERRISGPFRDRVDLQVQVRPVHLVSLRSALQAEPSEAVRVRVQRAREQLAARGQDRLNAALGPADLSTSCPMDRAAERTIAGMSRHYGLTGRGFHGVLRVARSIADLDAREVLQSSDLLEACEYRAA